MSGSTETSPKDSVRTRHRYLVWAAFCLLLIVMVTEVGLSTRRQSPSWDEGDHIYSGYMNWLHGEYSLNPEHPPLVKLVATLPLLPLHLKIAPRQGRFFKDEAYFGGRELLFRNDPKYGGLYSADTLLFRIHMSVLSFGLTLAVLVFLCANEMFGTTAALIALTLFVFDPTILANAPFVATDTGAACGIFASVYTFYRFLKRPSWFRGALCGVAIGLALGAKHSTVLLLPILLILAAGEVIARSWHAKRLQAREALRVSVGMISIAAVSILTLWGIYSFRYAMQPVGETMPSLAIKMATLSPTIRAAITFCAQHHLLPESYLYGLADVQQVGLKTSTYFFGKVYEHGLWNYFPAILALKFTVGVLVLLALAVFSFATVRTVRGRELFFIALPPAFYLAVAMAGPLNIGVRHVLPVFPFVFVLAAAGAAALIEHRRVWAYPVALLLLFHIAESVRVFPNYLPFANVLWGGPAKTNLYFTDSAVDWAQQLKFTREYVDSHHIHECYFAYFAAPFLLPSDYGIPCKPLPTLDTWYAEDIDVPLLLHGPVLVSYGDLNGYEFGTKVRNPYQSLFLRKPDDVIADGIAVFHGDVSLPDASAMQPIRSARIKRTSDPQSALADARRAVTISPRNLDANLILGELAAASGDLSTARAAYRIALERVDEMEPEARKEWQSIMAKEMKSLPPA